MTFVALARSEHNPLLPEKVLAKRRSTLRLAYALRAFLETAERDFVPQWPVRTPGVPQYVADAAIEYRAELARRIRERGGPE